MADVREERRRTETEEERFSMVTPSPSFHPGMECSGGSLPFSHFLLLWSG